MRNNEFDIFGTRLPIILFLLIVLFVSCLGCQGPINSLPTDGDLSSDRVDQSTADLGLGTGPQVSSPEDPNDPTEPTVVDPSAPAVKEPAQIPEGVWISCQQVASFNGRFVEDGQDRPVNNVAAILVRNDSDRFLEFAILSYEIDGKQAVFQISGLPSGASCWVMESSAMKVSDVSAFTYVDAVTSFRSDIVRNPDEISYQVVDGMISAKNESDRVLDKVIIYYKKLHTDGNYFGGITYIVDLGTLAPGETVEKIAGHYEEGWTKIVRVSWLEVQGAESS